MSQFISTLEQYLVDTAIGWNWDAMRQKLERLKRAPGSEQRAPGSEPFEGDEGIQLHSIDSLVVYHHMVLDRILRAALLAPSAGHQVTFKVLMALFGCILDLGKAVKEVERGLVGWQDGAERIEALVKEWDERETIFVSGHAIALILVACVGKIVFEDTKKGGRETGGSGGFGDFTKW